MTAKQAFRERTGTGRTGSGDGRAEAAPAGSRRRNLLVRLTAVTLATLACLVVLEVAFRIAGYQPIYRAYSKPDLFWRHDDLLGWSQAPGSQGTFVGPAPFPVEFRTPVRINSLGLRGPEVDAAPPEGSRVLVLGDSFVAGLEVAEEDTYSALLEHRLPGRVQVVNAGVRGYGTDQAYLYYRERGRHLGAGVVMLHETRNDPEDNTTLHRMRRPFGKPAFAPDADGELALVGHPVPRYPQCSNYRALPGPRAARVDTRRHRVLCWIQTRLSDHSAFLTFVTTRMQRNPALVRRIYDLGTPEGQADSPDSTGSTTSPPTGGTAVPVDTATPPPEPGGGTAAAGHRPAPPGDYAHRVTSLLIRKLGAEVRANGARLVLLVGDDEIPHLDEAGFLADGIEVVRVDPAQAEDPAAGHFSDGHLNELGHRRLADFLAPRLEPLVQP